MLSYGPFYETNPVPFSGGSSKARRKPRAVKRSGTECGLRAAAQISVAFANRAGLAGAAKRTLRSDRQNWTCALPDWP